jgi:UDP-N-acetylglucosamine--N-acetylmuramyl-(pentapeptide) pyrophosphoryl-undecaprenol N-acetylglucosamine transferase
MKDPMVASQPDASTVLRRIAVAGGGTAGHILPALAILRAFRERHGEISACFIGCRAPGGLETRLVPALGEELEAVRGGPWARQGPLGKASALLALMAGVGDALLVLRQRRVQLLIGVGGYASLGACIAGRLLGIPVVIHEANATPGLANRLVARLLAQRICVGFDETAFRLGNRRRVLRTGTPSLVTMDLSAPQRRKGAAVRLLVLGGSLGSPHLNREAPALIAMLSTRLRERGRSLAVRHFSGLADPRRVVCDYLRAGVPASMVRVEPLQEVFPASAYREADLAISCAGGVTLAELAVAGVPALLVPLGTASASHQIENARLFHELTGCPWVREEAWDAAGQATGLMTLLDDAEQYNTIRRRMRQWATPDAAHRVVRMCEDLLCGVAE